MQPMNLKELFAERYQIAYDEAAVSETGGRRDPWLFIIPCRYGHISPHSGKLLAVYCDSPRLISKLVDLPGVFRKQMGETEAILAFPLELFEQVALVVKPRRRRKLSSEHRESLLKAGREHRYSSKHTALSA